MATGATCIGCPFLVSESTCRLPIGKPTGSITSARGHYRQYFRRPCYRRWDAN